MFCLERGENGTAVNSARPGTIVNQFYFETVESVAGDIFQIATNELSKVTKHKLAASESSTGIRRHPRFNGSSAIAQRKSYMYKQHYACCVNVCANSCSVE